MATPFSKLIKTAKEEPGSLTIEVPEDWMQGRSVFGGLQVALALRAMRTLVPDVIVRTLQTTFVAPVTTGLLRIRANVLRTGKSATHIEARLIDETATLAIVIGVFGAARSSAASVIPVQPDIVASEPIELEFVPSLFPNFTQHFIARWLRGTPPFTGDAGRQHVLEIGMKDEGTSTEGHVVAIADLIPPVALSHLGSPAPGSTLTWMMEFLGERVDNLPLTGWRVDAELVAARDGYTSQSIMVWSPDGAPIAISRQSMLVFG
jgi:acyl-CoA thioesterase